jgi:hypothetical protein
MFFTHWLLKFSLRTRLSPLPSRTEWLDSLTTDQPNLNIPDLRPDCAICYRAFNVHNPKRARIRLSCGHRDFCRECLKQWSAMGKTGCPLCRKQLWYPHLLGGRAGAGQYVDFDAWPRHY